MQLNEVMQELEALGSEQTKRTYVRHGAPEPLFGVKVGDMKKLTKHVKKNQQLALDLYRTGNSDAKYLAGLSVNPRSMTKEQLIAWAQEANWYMLSEYTVAQVTAESPYALELAREWIDAEDELLESCGWSTYANYVSITADEELPLDELRGLLKRVEETIHAQKNRVRYTMNGFVIAVGCYVQPLHEEAVHTAGQLGKVNVNMGDTACKVPEAPGYIQKVAERGSIGQKRKTCIC
ncbi:DNA alkylation repair protein [Paenibacillus sp. YYML68]|uniref:DNA alkylation repair protein n=1 Tax=Paenibacillus sp. YYML68 TaxID=2909250 RepID=UPI00248F66BE|nr:DNA alkylation repair protein [Paenibacillus sp. YYML68]